MLVAAATDETTATFTPSGSEEISSGYTHYVEWGTGVTAGVVEIEGSNDSSFAGTWAPIHTFTYAAGAPKAEYVYSQAQFKVMRHRISTAVANGTVSTSVSGSR